MTAAALLAACLTGCSLDEAPLPVPAPEGDAARAVAPEWQAIPMDGEIADVDATYSQFLTVTGRADDGAPLVAAVDGTDVIRVATKVPDDYGTGATSATGDYSNEGFVQQAAPALGRPARVYVGSLDTELGGELEEWYRQRLVHPDGGRPPWASLLFDDEGDVRAVTARRERGSWQAHLWEVHPDDGRWRVAERGVGPRLRDAPAATSVVTSTGEVRVHLAETTDAGARLWSIDADPYFPTRWRREELVGGADSVTDILSWAVGTWVAGTRNGQAVIWDFDAVGGEVDLPDVTLDPEAPVVRLLRLPIGDQQPAFAAQRPDGPSVWVRGTSQWRELKAPAGTISLAAATDQGFYLVIDDVLWFRPLAWDAELS
jgi:hypothetical protein